MLKRNDNVQALVINQVDDVKRTLLAMDAFMNAETTPETVPETLYALMKSVCEAERVADISLRAMIDSLQGGRYLPSTREDIIAIATRCDKVANKCESVAKNTVYRHFRFPAEYSEDIRKVMKITVAQFELLETAISMLFSKLGALQRDHSVLDEIRRMESRVDAIEDKLHEAIFDRDMPLAEKIQTEETLDMLCDISDIIEDIADKIQIMLIARKA